jgi:hypothetical protein
MPARRGMTQQQAAVASAGRVGRASSFWACVHACARETVLGAPCPFAPPSPQQAAMKNKIDVVEVTYCNSEWVPVATARSVPVCSARPSPAPLVPWSPGFPPPPCPHATPPRPGLSHSLRCGRRLPPVPSALRSGTAQRSTLAPAPAPPVRWCCVCSLLSLWYVAPPGSPEGRSVAEHVVMMILSLVRSPCVGVWVCGCVGAWVRGCVGAWVRGCVGAWVRGRGQCCWAVVRHNDRLVARARRPVRAPNRRVRHPVCVRLGEWVNGCACAAREQVRNYIPSYQQVVSGGWNIADCVERAYDVEVRGRRRATRAHICCVVPPPRASTLGGTARVACPLPHRERCGAPLRVHVCVFFVCVCFCVCVCVCVVWRVCVPGHARGHGGRGPHWPGRAAPPEALQLQAALRGPPPVTSPLLILLPPPSPSAHPHPATACLWALPLPRSASPASRVARATRGGRLAWARRAGVGGWATRCVLRAAWCVPSTRCLLALWPCVPASRVRGWLCSRPACPRPWRRS